MATPTLLHTPIAETIDPAIIAEITAQYPWIIIPGTFNARDIAGKVKNGYIFRSGTLENVSQEGLDTMRELGIGVVFDLRSEKERVESPEVGFGDGGGIKGVWFEEQEEQVGDGEVEKTVATIL